MATVHDIANYQFKQNEQYIFDTNVWLYIYGPNPPDPKLAAEVEVYSWALARIRELKSIVVLPIVGLFEFLRAYEKIELGNLPPRLQTKKRKHIRNDPFYRERLALIAGEAKRILKVAELAPVNCTEQEMSCLLDDFGAGGCDFGDQLLGHLAKTRNLKIVSHDRDFQSYELDVLTANYYLLL